MTFSLTLGRNEDFTLLEPLDTWLSPPDWVPNSKGVNGVYPVPEVGGSSARVFRTRFKKPVDRVRVEPAVKLMRPDKKEYALPLFEREVAAMRELNGNTGITSLLLMGFLKLDNGQSFPKESAPLTVQAEQIVSGERLSGNAECFPLEESKEFLSQLKLQADAGHIPFLVFKRRTDTNLYLMADRGHTAGRFRRHFPVTDALTCAIQICDILTLAHSKKMTYLDHKLLHYYWNPILRQVSVIDWNIGGGPAEIDARRNPGKTFGEQDISFDLVQFAARALHHLMVGEQHPDAGNVGPTRPETILNSRSVYESKWDAYAMERLTEGEREFLEKALQGQYASAEHMKLDLEALLDSRLDN